MKYTVNKEAKTIELLSEVFTAKELSDLIEQFEDYSFSVSFSPQKSEKQGMIIGEKYVPIIGNINHS